MNNPRNDRTPAREMLRLALETQSAGMLPGDGARLAASDDAQCVAMIRLLRVVHVLSLWLLLAAAIAPSFVSAQPAAPTRKQAISA